MEFSSKASSLCAVVCVLAVLLASVASLPAPVDTATAAQAGTMDSEETAGQTLKTGMKVLEQYVGVHLYRIPGEVVDVALYKAMYSLSVMEQYVRLIGSLNLTSNRLDFFADLMERILSDSCLWINSLNAPRDYPAIDCNDRADFIPTLLALGLRPFVEESSSYLTDRYSSSSNNHTVWIASTFEDPGERCEFCSVVDGSGLC